jgi:hypothetical protein
MKQHLFPCLVQCYIKTKEIEKKKTRVQLGVSKCIRTHNYRATKNTLQLPQVQRIYL